MNTQRQIINAMIDSAGSTIFNVEFIKKDGSIRKMQARTGVQKGLTGAGSSYGQAAKDTYVTLYDMQKGAYRSVNRDTIQKLSIRGKTYKVFNND